MNLAAELAGSNPIDALKGRVTAYWDRQTQFRLIASLKGLFLANVAENAADMIHDITAGGITSDGQFNAGAVIDAALTLGDRFEDIKGIAMHSTVYARALSNDLIEFLPQSSGVPIKTFRGLAVTVDDGLTYGTNSYGKTYLTVLFGTGAVGYAVTAPQVAPGTEVYNAPASGNGGGQQTLFSRINIALHPLGYQWVEGTIASDSPSIAELGLAAHWTRVVPRKAVPLAFLLSNEQSLSF